MGDRELLQAYVETWKRACDDLLVLARSLSDAQLHVPTDLEGWDVVDNIAHTAHLEAVLAGAPEETVEVAPAPHIRSLTGYYTEQGVVARRGRPVADLADELEQAVATRYAELQAHPPTDGAAAPARTPGGVPWSTEVLLGNRPLDVWMHEQDIRRAIGETGGWDSPAAAHTVRRLGGALPMVLGKRVSAPTGTSVVLAVPEVGYEVGALVGDDGRATFAEPESPTARIELTAQDFVVLAGGRRRPEQTLPVVTGDAELAARLLHSLAVTP